ncbi:hypothetical protein ACIQ6Y_03890 [Streptomyces sp. NPDC096205]|uniref:hypothetical protein n=1 Tax=Streptomyces sp. NPDC096205 TaxID=3366081 RepID=UPI0037FB8B90
MADDAARAGPSELERLRARVAVLEAERAEHTARAENAERALRAAHPPRHRLRSLAAALLIVLGCVLAPLSLVAAWSADLVGDTDRYVDTVAPLAKDRDVQNAAADAVTGAVMHHLDLPALLQSVAPADRPLVTEALGRLGPSLESAVRSFVHDKARAVVASDAFERIWTEANRRIHGAVDEALTGGGDGTVTLDDDTVSVDLGPVAEQVKRRLVDSGLTVAGRIPELHTRLTVVESEDIGKVRTYVRLLRLAGFWLPVLAVLLIAAGVLLAAHRRRTLITAALCFAFAALVLGVALTVFRGVYLDALPSAVSRPAAGSVYDTLIRHLRAGVRTVVALGVVIATAAWLSGPGRWAGGARQIWHSGIGAARGTADRLGLRTGPVGPFAHRFRTWITWLLVAGAVVAYALWPYPTGWVVAGLALALLFALSLVDFLAEEAPHPHPRERTAP